MRELEQQVAAAKEQKRHLEGQSANVKTNDQYRALMSEIKATEEAIEGFEDQEIEAMYAVDAAREALDAAEGTDRSLLGRVAEGLGQLDARAAELAKDRERLRSARDEAAGRLDADLVAAYERVVARRRPGVSVVTEELCSGCRVGIPPQDFVDLIQAQRIVECQRCKRILVHAKMLQEPS